MLISSNSFIHRSKAYPFLKRIPDEWASKSDKQDWTGLEVLKCAEGKGVFATVDLKKNDVICNYGGHFLNEDYTKKYLLPYEEKCNYLLEMFQKYKGHFQKFYLNHDFSTETFGKYVNHSKLHPNLEFKIYVTEDEKLDVIFIAKKNIAKGSEVLWNYGKSFNGVNDCVKSCSLCKK